MVRGVHFQPVSYFGRVPELPKDEDRFTLDELMAEAVAQSGGLFAMENLAPSCCDHPMCGFHGDFIDDAGRDTVCIDEGHGPLTGRVREAAAAAPTPPQRTVSLWAAAGSGAMSGERT